MMKHRSGKHPPRIATIILEHILDKGILYGAMGDLEEQFHVAVESRGYSRAVIQYWLYVVISIPGFIRSVSLGSMSMFKNVLKINFKIS